MASRAAQNRPAMDAERRFYLRMAIAFLVTTILGFAPTYHLRYVADASHGFEPLRSLIFIHGLLFIAWVLLFIIQLTLIPIGRTDLARLCSKIAVGLITAMLLLSLFIALRSVHRSLNAPTGVDPRSWLAVPLLDIPVFLGLIFSALANLNFPPVRKRLVLVAMIEMMRPALGRLLPLFGAPVWVALLAPLLFLVPQIVRDVQTRRGRIHPATFWSSLAVFAVTVSLPIFWASQWWLAFAGWAAGLVA